MNWNKIKFNKFITLQRGFDLPVSEMKDGEIPVLGSTGIIGYHNIAKLNPPGVITGRSGTIGVIQYMDKPYWPHNTSLWVKDFKSNHPKFVYYKIKTLNFERFNGGASVPTLNRNNLDNIIVQVPDIQIQEKIADILSSYDDLNDINHRRIQLLEESARLLYREWFVYFRFPGHEKVKIVDGVPEGWEKVPISSLCSVHRGASPRPINNFLGGTIPWFKIGDATASESPFIIETKEAVIESGAARSVLLISEELILSNSATCGVPNFTGIQGCIHDGWLYFHDLKRVDKWFLYCFLNEKQKELLQGISEGSTQKNFNTSYVGSQLVLLPKKPDLLLIFCQFVEPIFKQIFHLAKYNKTLKEARDLLLPRLMSGAIEV